MNPHYLWLIEVLELLTFYVLGPALAIVIVYRSWREPEHAPTPKRHGIRCVAFTMAFLLLLALAKWIDADPRTPQYLLQLTCVLVSFLSLGFAEGYFFSVLLDMWRWHKTTAGGPGAER
jgi:hypothetical protein